MKNKITILTLLLFASLTSFSQLGTTTFNIATDIANNYSTGTWTDGSNLGTGFGTWGLTKSTSGSGRYIGGTGQSGTSFGLYSDGSGSFSAATRNLTSTLKMGEKITVNVGHTATINGEIFIQLLDNGTAVFTLKFVNGASNWVINDGGSDFNSGQSYSANTSITFTFTYNKDGTYSYTFGSGSGNNYTATNTISGINGIKFQSTNQGASQNFGFNNLSIDSKYTISGNSTVASNTNITIPYLDIQTGSTVNFGVASGATISGNLNVAGTMTIASDASTSGSLIVNGTSSGNITYNRYLTSGTSTKWHLIAAPVGGQSINTFVTTGSNNVDTNGVRYSLTPYNNTVAKGATGIWAHWTTDGSDAGNVTGAGSFLSGKGYEVLTTADGTVAFTGTVPVANVGIAITKPASNNAWNLIGNPFPSSIFANSSADPTNNFIDINTAALEASYKAIYLWNPGTSTYDLINQTAPGTAVYIAPGQGFFVKSVAGGGTVNFTTAMRTNQSAVAFQRSSANTTPTITLKADDGSILRTTEIKYITGKTLGLDPGYDAGLFDATGGNFSLYTKLVQDNGVNFMLQVLPDNAYNTTIVPIGLDAASGTQITFKADYSNLPVGKKVFLEDRLLGSFAELNATDKTYTLTLTSQEQGTGRFFLHTQDNQSTLATQEFNLLGLSVIAQPKNNSIRVLGDISNTAKLDIYDMLGRFMFTAQMGKTTDNTEVKVHLKQGIYIVKIQTEKGSYTTKIAWY